MSTATLPLAPGLHRDVPIHEYLTLPYMSASRLHVFAKSPAHYRAALVEQRKESDALDRGTALHLAILEPALFETRYVVAEPCEQMLKTGKRAGQPCGSPGLFRLRNGLGWACGVHVKGSGSEIETGGGVEVISVGNRTAVLGMADAIAAHPRARSLFEGAGEFEATVIFEDPETGVMIRTRPDRLVRRAGLNAELKSTRNAARWAFERDAESRGYWLKLALYRRGLRANGWPYQLTALLAVESELPYDPVPYLIDESDLDKADQEITRLLYRFKECERDNNWPGQASEFLTLRRPAYATRKNDDG
jgi:hypothetical protein